MPIQVVQSEGPPAEAWTLLQGYDNGKLTYIGRARSHRLQRSGVAVSSVTKDNPTTFAATGHGLRSGNSIVIEGATGSWAAINGRHKITVVSPVAFTISVNSSAYSGNFNGAVYTHAPRENEPVWAINRIIYSGDEQAGVEWAEGTSEPIYTWTDRATYSYQ